MKNVMDKVQKCIIFQQVNDVLNTYNRLSTVSIHDLSINSPILVHQKRNTSQLRKQKKSYNLLSIQGKSVMIELLYDPTKFRNTLLKLYFIDNQEPILNSPVSTQVPLIKESLVKITPAKIP